MEIGIGAMVGLADASDDELVTPPPARPLILSIGGQSNATKQGNTAATPAAKYADLGETYIWDHATGAFVPYVCGVNSGHRGEADGGAWGSEAEFAYQLRLSGDDRALYIVKECKGGQPLAASGGADWHPTSNGERYDGYVAQVSAAKTALGDVPVDEVFLWNQGEADSNFTAPGEISNALAYEANLRLLLESLSADGAFSGTFVIERIRPSTVNLSTLGYAGQYTVREAQETVAADEMNVRIISLDFLPSNFGNLHPAEPWTEGAGLRGFAAWRGTHDGTFGAISDDTPSNLAFADVADAAPSTVVTSTMLAIAGIAGHADVGVANGEYRVLNPDASVWRDWGAAPGTIHPGQTLQLRLTTAAGPSAQSAMSVTVGGASTQWAVTTQAAAPPPAGIERKTPLAEIQLLQTSDGGANYAATGSLAVGAGETIIAVVALAQGAAITPAEITMTANAAQMVPLARIVHSGGASRPMLGVFALTDAAAGSYALAVDLNGKFARSCTIAAAAYAGLDTAALVAQALEGQGMSQSYPHGVTPSAVGNLLLNTVATRGGLATWVEDSGTTELFEAATGGTSTNDHTNVLVERVAQATDPVDVGAVSNSDYACAWITLELNAE